MIRSKVYRTIDIEVNLYVDISKQLSEYFLFTSYINNLTVSNLKSNNEISKLASSSILNTSMELSDIRSHYRSLSKNNKTKEHQKIKAAKNWFGKIFNNKSNVTIMEYKLEIVSNINMDPPITDIWRIYSVGDSNTGIIFYYYQLYNIIYYTTCI